jgi:hypothetical protein
MTLLTTLPLWLSAVILIVPTTLLAMAGPVIVRRSANNISRRPACGMPGEDSAERDACHRAGSGARAQAALWDQRPLPKRCTSLMYNPANSRLERGYAAIFECAQRDRCA